MASDIKDVGNADFLKDIAQEKKRQDLEKDLSDSEKDVVLAAYNVMLSNAREGITSVDIQFNVVFDVTKVKNYFYHLGYSFVVDWEQDKDKPPKARLSWSKSSLGGFFGF